MVRIPTAIAADARLNPLAPGTTVWTICGLMKVSAKNPSTTLGMPARISRIGFTIPRTRLEAYSAR